MAHPPERITVKRRRDEDPVEALYIQPKKYRASALWKLAGADNERPEFTQPLTASSCNEVSDPVPSLTSRIPTVRTTLPSEDFLQRQPDTRSEYEGNRYQHNHSPPDQITEPVKQKQIAREPMVEPRRFHLSRTSCLPTSSPYLSSKTTAQKHRKSRDRALAVFVERTGKVGKAKSKRRNHNLTGKNIDHLSSEVERSLVTEVERKRPLASAVERKWRTENWSNSAKHRFTEQGPGEVSKSDGSSQARDEGSLALASQLHRIALQETNIQQSSPGVGSSLKLKTQPKPPRPRQSVIQNDHGEHPEREVVGDEFDSDDENDYVLDTYIRSSTQPSHVTDANDASSDPSKDLDHSNVGILVIEDGEEELLWEALGDDDSDPEWNSEEEDENAEDFYGNDYPEDEVSSEDESGRGAYNYRHGASDDEQFGSDEPEWSDSDTNHGSKHSWPRDYS